MKVFRAWIAGKATLAVLRINAPALVPIENMLCNIAGRWLSEIEEQ